MNGKRIHPAPAAILLAAILLLAGARADAADIIAYISTVEGQVDIIAPGADDWETAEADMVLMEGDQIKTGPDGETIIAWMNGHTMKIYSLSLITVEEISSRRSGEEHTTLNVGSGKIFARAEKLATNGSTFAVKTPTAIAGVRGTQFMVEVLEDNTCIISLLEGELDIIIDQVEMILEENMQLELTADAVPEAVEMPAEVRNELEQESRSIGAATGGAKGSKGKSSKSGGGKSSIKASKPPGPPPVAVSAEDVVQDTVEEVLSNPDPPPSESEAAPVPPMPPVR